MTCRQTKMRWRGSCRGAGSTTTWPTAKPKSSSARRVPCSAWRISGLRWSRGLSFSSRRWVSCLVTRRLETVYHWHILHDCSVPTGTLIVSLCLILSHWTKWTQFLFANICHCEYLWLPVISNDYLMRITRTFWFQCPSRALIEIHQASFCVREEEKRFYTSMPMFLELI